MRSFRSILTLVHPGAFPVTLSRDIKRIVVAKTYLKKKKEKKEEKKLLITYLTELGLLFFPQACFLRNVIGFFYTRRCCKVVHLFSRDVVNDRKKSLARSIDRDHFTFIKKIYCRSKENAVTLFSLRLLLPLGFQVNESAVLEFSV